MSPDQPFEYVATSVSRTLCARLDRLHAMRGIGVFSGPPGIGKSTSIARFANQNDGDVAVITIPPGPKSGIATLPVARLVCDRLWDMASAFRHSTPPVNHGDLPRAFYEATAVATGWNDPVRRGERGIAGRLTIVLDEAQNLSRHAIEALRYLNDEAARWTPFQVGLVFIGNNEFALAADGKGHSVISAAVADRAYYIEPLSYSDVTPDDLRLFVEARLTIEPDAADLAVRQLSNRSDRSFRRAIQLCRNLAEEASAENSTTVTRQHVIAVLGLN